MNWVLIIGGLIPFWTALMIVFMNKGASQRRPTRRVAPDIVDDYDYDVEPAEAVGSRLDFLKKRVNLGFLSGLKDRIPRRGKPKRVAEVEDADEAQDTFDEANDYQPQMAPISPGIGVDLQAERRLWGKTLLIFAGAGFVNGLYVVLDYVFTAFRKTLGMKLPLAAEFKMVSNLTLVILGVSVIFSALKTGLKLQKS
ncbi:hypothetical protein JXL21_03895 [Candidatus Bathyarchaeota archaeon]|nr:hypothetical protein [Candidatus Bathyarchaeota archaeon]